MTTNYLSLSPEAVETELAEIASYVSRNFGALSAHQLNWRPNVTSWSVAQCLDHLVKANKQMLRAMEHGCSESAPRAWWQRLELHRLFGRLLIRTQMPTATRKFTAPAAATPSSSAIPPSIIDDFIAHQQDAAKTVCSVAGSDATGIVMVSPFVPFITYSLLDGCRLLVAHERRHVEQALRVTQHPQFPRTQPVTTV